MVSDIFILQAGNKNLQQRLCKILNNNATGLHHDGCSQQKLYFWCLCVTYVYAICFSSVTVSIGNVPWVFVLVKSYLQRCFHTDSCLIRKVGQSIYYLNHINSLSTHKHRNKCTQYFPALWDNTDWQATVWHMFDVNDQQSVYGLTWKIRLSGTQSHPVQPPSCVPQTRWGPTGVWQTKQSKTDVWQQQKKKKDMGKNKCVTHKTNKKRCVTNKDMGENRCVTNKTKQVCDKEDNTKQVWDKQYQTGV